MKYIITAPTNKPYAASDKENNTPASKILFPNSRKRKRFIQSTVSIYRGRMKFAWL